REYGIEAKGGMILFLDRYFFLCIICISIVFISAPYVHAEDDVLILHDEIESVDLYDYFMMLSDNEEAYSIEAIASGQYDDDFISPEEFPTKQGFFKIGKWLKLDIQNDSSHKEWVLEFAFPIIYDIHL